MMTYQSQYYYDSSVPMMMPVGDACPIQGGSIEPGWNCIPNTYPVNSYPAQISQNPVQYYYPNPVHNMNAITRSGAGVDTPALQRPNTPQRGRGFGWRNNNQAPRMSLNRGQPARWVTPPRGGAPQQFGPPPVVQQLFPPPVPQMIPQPQQAVRQPFGYNNYGRRPNQYGHFGNNPVIQNSKEPPLFYGKPGEDFELWLKNYNAYGGLKGFDNPRKLVALQYALRDYANGVLLGRPDNINQAQIDTANAHNANPVHANAQVGVPAQ